MLLTEEDLRLHLGRVLMAVPLLRAEDRALTIDGQLATRLHANAQWFAVPGWNGNWTWPDFTILDPTGLRIQDDVDQGRLPAKQFHFGGTAIVIELKFNRDHRPSRAFLRTTLRDAEKIKSITARWNDVQAFQVVFSKYDHPRALFEASLVGAAERCTAVYGPGSLPA